MAPILLLFVDGIGLAPRQQERNPFRELQNGWLTGRLGAPLVAEAAPFEKGSLVLRALDANLGIAGLPQSATGQATLFTGRNAARVMKRHVAAFPGPRLRALLEEDNLLKAAARAGRSVAFANTFSPVYFDRLRARRLRESVTVVCARSAGVRFRTLEDLHARRAITWDLERDLFLEGLAEHPVSSSPEARLLVEEGPISARRAGRDLARLSDEFDLVLCETFLSDLVGHGRTKVTPQQCARRLDELLAGVAEGLGETSRVTVVVTSDHGNLEEVDHRRHTRNQVPLLVWGPASRALCDCRSLQDVTPILLEVLNSEEVPVPRALGEQI